MSDQASRIIFNVAEDVGGGISALGQFDLRFNVDAPGRINPENAPAGTIALNSNIGNPVSSGNNHIGLKFAGTGTLRAGRQDIYYVENASLLPAGLFLAANPQPVLHSLATTNASRTPNLIWFTSDRINGFEGTVGYSTNPIRESGAPEVENDMGTKANQRKGGGTYLKLNYNNGPLDMTYAMVDLKSDNIGGGTANAYVGATGAGAANTTGATYLGGTNATRNDQKGQTITVKYQATPNLRIAGAWSNEKQIATNAIQGSNGDANSAASAAAAAAVGAAALPSLAVGQTIQATAYGIGAAYNVGPHQFTVGYNHRGNLSYAGVDQANTGLGIQTIAYSYDFSKRTAVGVMYTQLKADANIAAGLFYQTNNAFGGNNPALTGETQTITSVALRHNF